MTKMQILIIGEDLAVYDGIKAYMESSSINIGCTIASADALEYLMQQEYCLVIIDLCSVEGNSLESLHAIRSVQNIPILALTDPLEPDKKLTLFQAGASVCMEKPVDVKVCVAQTMSLIHLYLEPGCMLREPFPLIFGAELVINPLYRQVIVDGVPIELTRTEFDLFFCLAQHHDQVWSQEQLYRYVWNDDLGINDNHTVKTHIGNLKKKLAALGKNYIQNSRGVGYKFVPPLDNS